MPGAGGDQSAVACRRRRRLLPRGCNASTSAALGRSGRAWSFPGAGVMFSGAGVTRSLRSKIGGFSLRGRSQRDFAGQGRDFGQVRSMQVEQGPGAAFRWRG